MLETSDLDKSQRPDRRWGLSAIVNEQVDCWIHLKPYDQLCGPEHVNFPKLSHIPVQHSLLSLKAKSNLPAILLF